MAGTEQSASDSLLRRLGVGLLARQNSDTCDPGSDFVT